MENPEVLKNNQQFQPIGLSPSSTLLNDQFICFDNIPVDLLTQENNTMIEIALIARIENYKNEKLFTNVEYGLVYTSAALYTIGTVFIFLCYCIGGPTGIMMIGLQCCCLFIIRSIYFYLLGDGYFLGQPDIGEFVLIEMPTFFYLGILLQILTTYHYISKSRHT